jgi:hypothetical protein
MSTAPLTVRAAGRDWRCVELGPATFAGTSGADGPELARVRYRCECVAEPPLELIVAQQDDRVALRDALAREIDRRRRGG